MFKNPTIPIITIGGEACTACRTRKLLVQVYYYQFIHGEQIIQEQAFCSWIKG